MSWPQWSQQAAPPMGPMPPMPTAVAPPVVNPAPPVVQPVAPPQYTQEQWSQMQQQNWTQWAQWQQQYQQWHQQYGAEYQKSMNAIAQASQPQQPMLPNMGVPPPPPQAELKPPLPTEQPPPPAPNYPPAAPLQPMNLFNQSAPPPPPVKQTPQPATNFQRTNANWSNQQPPRYNEPLKRNFDQQNEFDAKRHVPNNRQWQQGTSSGNQSQTQNQPPALMSLSIKPVDQRPKDNTEQLSEAEKKFDKQFKDWEAQFNKWKEQNSAHPDKEQYREYEKKWENWREQLLERREQMRRKRLGLAADPPKNSPQTTKTVSLNAQNQPAGQVQTKQRNEPTQPNMIPPRNEPSQVVNRAQIIQDDRIFGDNRGSQNFKDSIESSRNVESPSMQDAPHLFQKPPPNLNDEPLQFKNKSSPSTQENEPIQSLPVGDFIKPSEGGGIPGLDLVKYGEQSECEEKENEIAENEKKNVALEAISKGINNILGDQKLLNMLSLVTQGQGQKLRDNVTNIQSEIKDPGVDGSNVQQEQSNSSFDDPSLREGPQREAIHNFDDQTRSSFTTGQPEQFDNNPSLLHNERQLGPNDRSGVQPNNANFSQFGQGPGPNMFGPNNNSRNNNLGFDRGPMRNFGAMDGPNRNSFDFNEGPNRGGFAPNEGSNRNNEGPNQDTFGPSDGPRGNFRSNEGPRGNFGPNDPLKSNLGPNSGTRGNFAQNDGPRGNFRPNEGPRSNFGANDGPRRNFGHNDGPRGNFGSNDGPSPRGNFGPNDGPSPRGNFGPNDGTGPRGNFDPNDGPSPRGNFGPNDGPSPRGNFGPNDGPSPRSNFGPNDDPSSRGNIGTKDGPSPRGNFGPNDGPSPRGNFGLNDDFSPRGNFGPNDGPSPRSNFSPNDAPGPRGNFDANDGPPRGNFGPNDGPNPRGNFGLGDFPRGNIGPNDGPRGYFGPNDGPRGNFGPNDGPPRGNFGPNDGPKSGFGPNDSPRNNFGPGEGQRGNFASNDGPMGNFGTRDTSWGNFGPRDGPRGPFRPNDGPNQGPRGNFNANDGPRGKFDNEPWRFPDGPKNNFGPNNFSRRNFGPNDGPRGGFESNDDPHNFGSNDDLRDNFGPNDGPRNSFGSNDGSQPHSKPNERHCTNFGPNDRSDKGNFDSTGNYDNYDDDQYAESNFYEDDWDEPKENVPNPPTIPKPTEELLQPATVIDYEHKSIKTDDEFEVLIEPLHKFDYRHTSLRRIPFPQRPQWLNETVRNIMEFEPPRVQLRTLFPPPVESWSGERYPEENRHRYDNRPPYEQQQKRFYDNRRYERGRFEEKRFEENMRFEEDVGFEDNKNYNDSKEQFKDNSRSNVTTLGLAEDVLSDPEWPDDDAEGEPFKKIQKTETGKQANKSNKIFIEDILNPPGRYNRPPRIVIILRGPPGSGKTFLAKLIKDREVENGGSAPRILSLDDYFMVEQEKEITEDGKLVKIKEMVYEYEAEMEESYRTSLMKSFKKTITDGYFSFIIVDNVNDKVKYFGEMWSFAKQHGFQVYICQMDLDVHTCSKRNIHDRTEEEIENCVCGFEPTPSHHPVLDATSLLQSVAIPEVEMEEVNSPENEMDESDAGEDHVSSSKWDNFDCSLSNLARLDGLSKPLRPSRTMEEYLQMDTEWTPTEPTKPGQKRVRWADLEEQKQQRKMREIGFVVGHTNWERMMDPTEGGSALTQTKYIEKTGRFKVSDFR